MYIFFFLLFFSTLFFILVVPKGKHPPPPLLPPVWIYLPTFHLPYFTWPLYTYHPRLCPLSLYPPGWLFHLPSTPFIDLPFTFHHSTYIHIWPFHPPTHLPTYLPTCHSIHCPFLPPVRFSTPPFSYLWGQLTGGVRQVSVMQ